MNYILQSGVYLTDKNGKYHLELDIPLTFAPDEWEWSLAFERDSRSERGPALWLHWPGNEAVSLGEAEDFNY